MENGVEGETGRPTAQAITTLKRCRDPNKFRDTTALRKRFVSGLTTTAVQSIVGKSLQDLYRGTNIPEFKKRQIVVRCETYLLPQEYTGLGLDGATKPTE